NNAYAAQLFLVKGPASAVEVAGILADIIADNRRAAEIIRRMRSLVRKETPELVPLDLSSAIREVVLLVQGDATSRAMRVTIDARPDLPRVCGVKVQVQQVLLNLLLNAFAAMRDRPNERVVSVLVARRGADQVLTSIRD